MTYKDFSLGDWIGHISGAIEDERELDGNEMRDLVEFLSKMPRCIPVNELLLEEETSVSICRRMRTVSDKEKLIDFALVSPGQCFVSNGTYYVKIADVKDTYEELVIYNAVAISDSVSKKSGELCYFDKRHGVSIVNLEARVV